MGTKSHAEGKKMRKSTPWGEAQSGEVLADGIYSYSTASHGGIWLSAERQQQIAPLNAKNFLNSLQWWEEDCDWAIPYLFFNTEIRAFGEAYEFENNTRKAQEIVKHCHPECVASLLPVQV